jgi:hypothetical protein
MEQMNKIPTEEHILESLSQKGTWNIYKWLGRRHNGHVLVWFFSELSWYVEKRENVSSVKEGDSVWHWMSGV